MSNEAKVREAVQALRLRLVREFPYLAPPAFRMRGPVITTMPRPTMAVDAEWRLYVDPRVIDKWDVVEMLGVVAHEIWHLVLRHPMRGRARSANPRVWNLAVDCVVNQMLVEAGVTLPDKLYFPETFDPPLPPDLTADEYYDLLMDRPQGDLPECDAFGGSCSDGQPREWELAPGEEVSDDGSDAGMPGEAETNQIAREVAKKLEEHVRSCGGGHGMLSRWADGMLAPPKVPWQRVLAGAVRAALAETFGAVDYSYRRPSRRQCACSVLLPSLRRPVPNVAVVVDTSGSMSESDLAAAMSEVAGVLRASGSSITLLACDTDVAPAQKIMRVSAARLVGGGGTDMSLGLLEAAKLQPRPDLTIVLTDGATGWPATKPACGRVIVGLVCQSSTRPPAWARTIEIER